MSATPQEEARAALDAAGQLPDAELDLASVALQFARIDAPAADWRAAQALLTQIARRAVELAAADPAADGGDSERRRALLAGLIHGEFGFAGDAETYDDMANANLIQVLDRRRGLPVALGVLWLHAAEAAGWSAHGLNAPGHFLLALPHARGQIVLDVFAGGDQLLAPELRALIKRVAGENAELKPGMLAPMTKRDVLLRLQNNIKLRLIRLERLPAAAATLDRMLMMAPEDSGLWQESALVQAELGAIDRAQAAIDAVLGMPASEAARARMAALRQRLRGSLH